MLRRLPNRFQQAAPAPVEPAQPEVTVRQLEKRNGNSGKRKALAPAPKAVAMVPGQVQIDSNPQGAQIQIDGKSDPSWITPFDVTGLSPGQHIVAVSKSGYSADARAVDDRFRRQVFCRAPPVSDQCAGGGEQHTRRGRGNLGWQIHGQE